MDVLILCEQGTVEQGVPGHVLESSLDWMKAGDSIELHVNPAGATWVQHQGHEYQFAVHGMGYADQGSPVVLLRIVN